MIAVVDYGINNLRSVGNALSRLGYAAEVTADAQQVAESAAAVVPGVGSFDRAVRALREKELDRAVQEMAGREKPLLGICLGMQLFFDSSEESLEAESVETAERGLGLFTGRLERFRSGQKVPHMGWNQLEKKNSCPLLRGIPDGAYMYFVHSYYLPCAQGSDRGRESLVEITHTHYGLPFVSMVQEGTVFGTQFHPEKSGQDGLRLLENFGRLVERHKGKG
jgi:glutamine amidotransferase